MENYTDILQKIRRITRLFERCARSAGEKYGLTATEMDVLAFLANNPGRDTASDIVELRMLPKANVSQAVESLIEKGMLSREQDSGDRRKIHLTPTESAQEPTAALGASRESLFVLLFDGFTAQDRAAYAAMNERIAQNAAKVTK